MRYDIIVNLDYENYPHEEAKCLFRELQQALLGEGFVMDGRRFTIDANPDEAQRLARSAISSLELRYQQRGSSIYPLIKECFGFEPEHSSNLLLPPTEEIEVEELADFEGVEVDQFLHH